MPAILLKKASISSITHQLEKMQSESENAKNKIYSALAGLDFEVASKKNIQEQIRNMISSEEKQISYSQQCKTAFVNATNAVTESDMKYGSKSESIFEKIKNFVDEKVKSVKEFFIKNKLAKYAAVAGLFVASPVCVLTALDIKLLAKLASIVSHWFTTTAHAEEDAGKGGNSSGGGRHDGDNPKPPEENPPQENPPENTTPEPTSPLKTEDEIRQEIEARSERLKNEHGSFDQRCGGYTYQQLEDQGLVAGSDVGGSDPGANGKDWIETWEGKETTSTGASVDVYRGENSLADYINQHSNESITNIVVSYDDVRGPEKYGHALLISRIQDGKIYFTDTEGAIKWRKNSNGQAYHEGEMAVMSLEEFMKYPGSHYKLKGIIHFSK